MRWRSPASDRRKIRRAPPVSIPGRGRRRRREEGHALIFSFLLVALLVALSSAHVMVVQKNVRQSRFYNHLSVLRPGGESGVQLALYELTYKMGGADGDIGTELWTPANDVGADGRAGTGDEGEGDGAPTPGEPGTVPAPIGLLGQGMNLLVKTSDTAWPDVKRIASVSFDAVAMMAQEAYVRELVRFVPGVGAIFVEPEFTLDVNGNSFLVTGSDTNPGGSPGPGSKVAGIATSTGDPAGSNSSTLVAQMPPKFANQVVGSSGPPSVSETDAIDFEQVWSWLSAAPRTVELPGTYSDGTWGSAAANDYRVTYCKGDLELSGSFVGAGILMVEGNLIFSGHSEFSGIVIVRGNATLTGGGNGVHIYGSLLLGKSETNPNPTLTVSGNSTAAFSSLALANACKLIPPGFTVLSWREIK